MNSFACWLTCGKLHVEFLLFSLCIAIESENLTGGGNDDESNRAMEHVENHSERNI